MPTSQKTEIVNELTKKFQDSSGIYLARYTGMNVDHATKIRKMFRENDVTYYVSKNTLTRLAAKNAGFDDKLDSVLQGQIGIAYAYEDPTAPARVIKDFISEHKDSSFEVVGLIFDGEIFDADKYKELANLPSKDQLISKLLGGLNQPMTKLVGTMSGAMSKLAMVLSDLKEKKS